jgi:hypothetical protein
MYEIAAHMISSHTHHAITGGGPSLFAADDHHIKCSLARSLARSQGRVKWKQQFFAISGGDDAKLEFYHDR